MSELNQDIALFFSLIREGNLEKVKELIDIEYDANALFEEGITPAIQAASYGHLEILKILVEAGADVNIVDQQMCPPLMAAKLKEHQEIVDYLYPLTSKEIRGMVDDQLTE